MPGRRKKRKEKKGLEQILFVLPTTTSAVSERTSSQQTSSERTSSRQSSRLQSEKLPEAQSTDGTEVKSFYESVVGLQTPSLVTARGKHSRKQLSPHKHHPTADGDNHSHFMQSLCQSSSSLEFSLPEQKNDRNKVVKSELETQVSQDDLVDPRLVLSSTKEEEPDSYQDNTRSRVDKMTVGQSVDGDIGTVNSSDSEDCLLIDTMPPITPQDKTQTKKQDKFLKRSSRKEADPSLPRFTRENKTHLINCFLQSSQQGQVAEVRRYLQTGVKIDAKDSFGWTALMCASHAGNTRMVKYLLQQGASVSVKDRTGKTAQDYARLTKHHKVTRLLLGGHLSRSKKKKSKHQPKETHYCEVCKTCVTDTAKHDTSTLHLFNVKAGKGAKGTSYFLPEHNKGYQLMVKAGWDKEKGLGPEGQGHKFPVKTLLKRDRQGLGCKTDVKAKVTHFTPGDVAAVKPQKRQMKTSTLSRKQRVKKSKKERDFERNFRLQFSLE